MDKQLKKKVEQKLTQLIEGILSGINAAASTGSRKKIKEAGKMVARKFVKVLEANKKSVSSGNKKEPAKKSAKNYVMPKRASNGKFLKKNKKK